MFSGVRKRERERDEELLENAGEKPKRDFPCRLSISLVVIVQYTRHVNKNVKAEE